MPAITTGQERSDEQPKTRWRAFSVITTVIVTGIGTVTGIEIVTVIEIGIVIDPVSINRRRSPAEARHIPPYAGLLIIRLTESQPLCSRPAGKNSQITETQNGENQEEHEGHEEENLKGGIRFVL